MNKSNPESAEFDHDKKSDLEPTIRLDHFLQAIGVSTGGQAKQLIQNGNVLVNGVVETRRRKKLREGDEVDLDGEVFIVSADD